MNIELDKHEIESILDALAIASQTAAGNMTEEDARTYSDQVPEWIALHRYLIKKQDNN